MDINQVPKMYPGSPRHVSNIDEFLNNDVNVDQVDEPLEMPSPPRRRSTSNRIPNCSIMKTLFGMTN